MIRKLRTADAAGDLGRQLRGYLRSSILIVDEVGYLPLNRHDANLVFQIIARRYEKGSVVITSNKTFSKAHTFAATCARCCRNLTGSVVQGADVSDVSAHRSTR
jgi:DNA replication protein DnaC